MLYHNEWLRVAAACIAIAIVSNLAVEWWQAKPGYRWADAIWNTIGMLGVFMGLGVLLGFAAFLIGYALGIW